VIRRMWRAFWLAMREPVRTFAPEPFLTLRVDVSEVENLTAVELGESIDEAVRLAVIELNRGPVRWQH
jgi:hypothetical protein